MEGDVSTLATMRQDQLGGHYSPWAGDGPQGRLVQAEANSLLGTGWHSLRAGHLGC